MVKLRPLSPVLNGLGLVLLFSQPGWSHGAIATVTQSFAVEARYSSGDPMAQAQVVVYGPDDLETPWTTGQTDANGKFEFDPDSPGNWEVVIRQAGHGTTVTVPVGGQPGQTAAARASPQAAKVSLAPPVQRWASAGAALWGLIGTVLFFSRGKQS